MDRNLHAAFWSDPCSTSSSEEETEENRYSLLHIMHIDSLLDILHNDSLLDIMHIDSLLNIMHIDSKRPCHVL